jgi:hypothetical protein
VLAGQGGAIVAAGGGGLLMDQPDPVTTALQLLPADGLARLSLSLALRARADRERSRPGMAGWRDAVRCAADAELVRRSGASAPSGRCPSSRDACLTAREQVALICELERDAADVEWHCCGPALRLTQALLDDLRRKLVRQRAGRDVDTVGDMALPPSGGILG